MPLIPLSSRGRRQSVLTSYTETKNPPLTRPTETAASSPRPSWTLSVSQVPPSVAGLTSESVSFGRSGSDMSMTLTPLFLAVTALGRIVPRYWHSPYDAPTVPCPCPW
ncbi:hypothetical protein [Thermomonospora cellulosilytica]|uniref:Uncharacterized protein n=1 Tax=Thermomonospora cellulosilytica TaxID=1411118 RepID=A0A7W3N0P8_9ACTN|nr:hypothetical protein [Thermomonospora cellulosilytica]MBA9005302.1 hypothetical protein [Thermomonospora cellulosilytica]